MPDAHVRAGPDPSHRRNLWTFPLPSCKSLAACDMRRGVSYVRISSSSPYQREAANGSKPLQRLSLESAHGVFGVSPHRARPPNSVTTVAALPYGTARMTMSPAGAAPYVPVVAPALSLSASARALAASRLITSTVCPALAIRPPIAAAMPPEPMMLIVLICSLLMNWGIGGSL